MQGGGGLATRRPSKGPGPQWDDYYRGGTRIAAGGDKTVGRCRGRNIIWNKNALADLSQNNKHFKIHRD